MCAGGDGDKGWRTAGFAPGDKPSRAAVPSTDTAAPAPAPVVIVIFLWLGTLILEGGLSAGSFGLPRAECIGLDEGTAAEAPP